MLGIVLNGRYLDVTETLERRIDYIHSFQRTKQEMAEKRPKWLKIVKNHGFSLISQRIANRKPLQK